GPWIVPFPEDARGAVHLDAKLEPPSARHWFGTDEVGTDIYTRVVLGARVSLQIRLIITLLATAIGVPLGIGAGYVGGPLGETIMRVTGVFLSVPALLPARLSRWLWRWLACGGARWPARPGLWGGSGGRAPCARGRRRRSRSRAWCSSKRPARWEPGGFASCSCTSCRTACRRSR